MSLAVVLSACLLAAAPVEGATPPPAEAERVFLMDVKSAALSPALKRAVMQRTAQEMSSAGAFSVVTMADVESVVDRAAQQSTMGCDEVSCMSEIAEAMGTNAVAYGDVVVTGEAFVLNLTYYEASDAVVKSRASITAHSEEALLRAVPRVVHDLVVPLEKRRGIMRGPRPEFVDDTSLSGTLQIAGWSAAAAGLAGIVVGAGFASITYLVASIQLDQAQVDERLDDATELQNSFANGPIAWMVWGGGAVAVVGLGAAATGGALLVASWGVE